MILIIGAWILIISNLLNSLLAFGMSFNEEARVQKGGVTLLLNALFSLFTAVVIYGLL